MIAVLRTVIYVCCIVIALMCGIAAFTIAVAIVTGKLPDSQAWMAVVFFAAAGGAAWMAGREAKPPFELDPRD
jgi:membrane protein implicated in regulation of membrane protease activity